MAARIAAALSSGGGGSSAVANPLLDAGYSPPPLSIQPPRSRVVTAPEFVISGTTRDANGVALAGCTVHLLLTGSDILIDVQVSDANGAFVFPSALAGYMHYLVAYLAGAPDVAGTTVNTLTGS